MAKTDRIRLGIIFNFDPRWMGGIIYILNIVRVLNFLEDKDKPLVFAKWVTHGKDCTMYEMERSAANL